MRKWTAEEEDYLREKWGQFSIPAIAKNLGRSVSAVKIRASQLELGAVLMSGDYITLNQLLLAVKGTNAGGKYTLKSWGENRGLPIHTKKVVKNTFRVVYLDEFWKWAEDNRSFLDFSKMEPLALGEEPAWVAEQRKKDFKALQYSARIRGHLPRTAAWLCSYRCTNSVMQNYRKCFNDPKARSSAVATTLVSKNAR